MAEGWRQEQNKEREGQGGERGRKGKLRARLPLAALSLRCCFVVVQVWLELQPYLFRLSCNTCTTHKVSKMYSTGRHDAIP